MPTIASRWTATQPAHQLGEAEREVERLARVQARVAERLVAGSSCSSASVLGAAEALGHVLARVLEVHAARPDALGAAGGEEALDLGHDRVEVARLAAAGGLKPFACIGSQTQTTGCSASRDRAQERRQQLGDALGAEPRDQRQPAGDAVRVQALAELDDLVGRRVRAELDADRVVDAREELDVRAVERRACGRRSRACAPSSRTSRP